MDRFPLFYVPLLEYASFEIEFSRLVQSCRLRCERSVERLNQREQKEKREDRLGEPILLMGLFPSPPCKRKPSAVPSQRKAKIFMERNWSTFLVD